MRSKSSPILVNLGLLFLEHKCSTADISDTFCRRVTKSAMFRGLPNRHLLSEFGELLAYFSGEQKKSTADISHIFRRSAIKFGSVMGIDA